MTKEELIEYLDTQFGRGKWKIEWGNLARQGEIQLFVPLTNLTKLLHYFTMSYTNGVGIFNLWPEPYRKSA